MKKTSLLIQALLMGTLAISVSGFAVAGKYNSLIPNPFVFCSAPKPCKYCHPWRAIYNEICADQVNARNGSGNETFSASAIFESVDQAGQKWYLRTVNGWTIRSMRRTDLEDSSLNGNRPIEGLEVIDGPIKEAQLR